MKLYAVVIGRKRNHTRYVAYDPFVPNRVTLGALAVRKSMKEAKKVKRETLKMCGHKDVFVIAFVLKGQSDG